MPPQLPNRVNVPRYSVLQHLFEYHKVISPLHMLIQVTDYNQTFKGAVYPLIKTRQAGKPVFG